MEDIAIREAHKSVDRMVMETLGLGSSRKKKMGGGFVSIEMSYKPGTLPGLRRPFEDEVSRDVVCPNCTLNQTVFGLAIWCADCGQDIFTAHVEAELEVIRSMLNDVSDRKKRLGKRIAAKDIENCLEDTVSIFEASIKAIVRRAMIIRNYETEKISVKFKKLGNAFQNIQRTQKELQSLFGCNSLPETLSERLNLAFEKRHPITHNLGVVDRKYIERAQSNSLEGRDIRVTEEEVFELLDDVFEAISLFHESLVPSAHINY